jgi:hypothetical protein
MSRGCSEWHRKLLLVYEAVLYGVHGRLGSVVCLKFLEDRCDVVLDGLLGQKKRFADLAIACTIGYQSEDFKLAVGQAFGI